MRILIAGDPRSIHTARFGGLIQELGHELHVFSVELQYGQDEHLRNVTLHVPLAYMPGGNGNKVVGRAPWLARPCAIPLVRRVLGRALYTTEAPGRIHSAMRFARVAARIKPDLVISLKMQNEGYTVARARHEAGEGLAPWLHFSWGTDMEYFGKHPDYASRHLPLIRSVLSQCDFHAADTRRDLQQACALGFQGRTLGAMPGNGGFDLDWVRAIRERTSKKRDVILVKGRHGGYVGKALNVVAAIRKTPELYRRHRIRFAMASAQVVAAVRALRDDLALDAQCLGRLPYEQLMTFHGEAVVAVSASDVDGTPNFLLEAMAMGALPVHSDMGSVREWVTDGVNARLFPVDDVNALSESLANALEDRALQQRAAEANWATIEERANRARLRAELDRWLASATRRA